MPIDMSLYPPNWYEFSKSIRLDRAKGRCECTGECAVHHLHPGPKHCVERNGPPKFASGKKIVLTTHHLCNCDPLCANENHVKAMCQGCHLRANVRKKRYHEAALRAAKTKGPLERTREALMAVWTRKHGKDDSRNPYST
jgi:hypothetical protein